MLVTNLFSGATGTLLMQYQPDTMRAIIMVGSVGLTTAAITCYMTIGSPIALYQALFSFKGAFAIGNAIKGLAPYMNTPA